MKIFGRDKKEKIITGIAGFLLLSAAASCTSYNEEDNPTVTCSFGYATYELNGVVINEKSQAINNAQVIITCLYDSTVETLVDTLTTDASGQFRWEQSLVGYGNDLSLLLKIKDQMQQYSEASDTVSYKNCTFADAAGEFLGKATENIFVILHNNNDGYE